MTYSTSGIQNNGLPIITIFMLFIVEWLYWYYQMCSEIGSFPTSNRVNDLFGQTIPLDYSEDYCTDTFGES